MTQELQPLPENPTPQDFGFPENPSSADVQRWARQERWLQALAETGSVGAACSDAGVPPSTIENWDLVDSWGFKKRRAWALERFMGRVEAEINRRAIEGTDHPVIYKGQITATYKEYSDNLLMFRAKKHDPSYRDNYTAPAQDNRQVHIHYNFHPSVAPNAAESSHQQLPEHPESGYQESTNPATDTGAE